MASKRIFIYLNIISIIILFFNYFSYNNKKKNSFYIIPISIDNFIWNNLVKTFKEISNELHKKMFSNKKTSNLTKKSITLYFEDNHEWVVHKYIKIFKEKYIINISPDNPDYLIYNTFGCNHLNEKYNNSIKIAIYSENQIPDFNIADYAISQHHIIYFDRYFRYPRIITILNSFKNFDYIRLKNINKRKTKFCAAVISNYKSSDNFRLQFISELNKYKRVDMGGKYKNNVGNISNKIEFLTSYKFSIAMENSEADGYASEKIVQSFLAGTIPIYYGDYMIDEYINPKSFILIRGEKDMLQKIEYIKKIDNNDKIYKKMLKKNILINNKIPSIIIKEYYEFLMHIFEQDKKLAKRTNRI